MSAPGLTTTGPAREPRAILVRGVNWLGDAVMTTPALERLRQRFPAAKISLLTPAKLQQLWAGHPAIDEVIPFEREEGLWSIGRRLRSQGFDTALIFPNSPRSALECRFGRIPQRIGYGGGLRSWLLTTRVPRPQEYSRMRKRPVAEIRRLASGSVLQKQDQPIPSEAHHVYHYLRLAAALGASAAPLAPRVAVAAEEAAAAQAKFQLPQAGPVVGINPGAEYGPAKRWPAAAFLEAARRISRCRPVNWIIFGGPADAALAKELSAGLKESASGGTLNNLAGQTSLRELMCLLQRCDVLLTNDTGPMHVAAALGTPVVVPFGSTSPELTGPGLPGAASKHQLLKAEVPCAPCFLRECPVGLLCMKSISSDRVAAAVEQVLAGHRSPSPAQ